MAREVRVLLLFTLGFLVGAASAWWLLVEPLR